MKTNMTNQVIEDGSIHFQNVKKVYPGGKLALSDVNLEIKKGEFVAIIGLSGAGKSTLLRCINKMHTITSGDLIVNGSVVNKLSKNETKKFRRHIGMVFQSYNIIRRATVERNVLTSLVPSIPWWRSILGIFTKSERLQALEALHTLNILETSYVKAGNLSGGQQQRVALARTLAQNPKIILADEPVAALDPIMAHKVMDDFRKVNKEKGITVIANMHHVKLALEYSDRVIGVKDGRVVFDGPSKNVNDDVLKTIYGDRIQEAE